LSFLWVLVDWEGGIDCIARGAGTFLWVEAVGMRFDGMVSRVLHVRGLHVRGLHVRGLHVRGLHVRGLHVRGGC
jgi:hypothetical protein